jgi:hypothetical protein
MVGKYSVRINQTLNTEKNREKYRVRENYMLFVKVSFSLDLS